MYSINVVQLLDLETNYSENYFRVIKCYLDLTHYDQTKVWVYLDPGDKYLSIITK